MRSPGTVHHLHTRQRPALRVYAPGPNPGNARWWRGSPRRSRRSRNEGLADPPGIAIDFIEVEHAAVLRATRAGPNPGNVVILLLNRGARELTGSHVDPGCPGHVDRIAGLHRLAVRGRLRRLRGKDDLFGMC